MGKTLLERQKIVETITNIPASSFTVLQFIDVFQSFYPLDWQRLMQRYGLYGEKRRYTVTTYLSNRIDLHSKQLDSLLLPLTPYSEDRSKDYRRPVKEERKRFGSPWIAVLKKREPPETWETAGDGQVPTASAAS